MPVDNNRYKFNRGLVDGGRLGNGLQMLENGRDVVFREIDSMEAALTGDPSNVASFSNITNYYGFGSNDYSQAAYFELLSLRSKLNTNASVTDVLAAMDQAFTRLR